MFILHGDFDSNPYEFEAMHTAFERYRNYLDNNRDKFLPSLFAFAVEQSNEDTSNRNFLHDSWVDSIHINETPSMGQRKVSIDLRLLGPYHDRFFLLKYSGVKSYSLNFDSCVEGHGDYSRGEIRLSDTDEGFYIHEFEWNYSSKSYIEFSNFDFFIELK